MSATISVSLQQCRNLRSPRAEHFTCFARVEHGPRQVGESGRVEGGGGETLSLGLETSIPCSPSDPLSTDEIAQNPLLVSVLEVLPKDKKAKEEKTAVLGQACVDLLPLLLASGQPSPLKMTVKLQDTSGTGSEEEAEVDVEVSSSQPLLREEQSRQSNVLTLRLRSLHSLPDTWQPPNFPFTLSLATPLPSSSFSSPTNITLPQGILKGSPDKDPSAVSSHWKWPDLPSAVGTTSLILERPIQPHPLEYEAGELNENKDVKFRRSAECDKPRVAWNVERRCWLQPEANRSLLQLLSQCPLWPVEVGRWSVPSGGGKGKGKEEESVFSYHGVGYVNLSPLLYPGVTHVCGAYPLHPYSEGEASEKTQRKHTSILAAGGATSQHGATPTKKTPGGAGKRTASTARLGEPSGVLPDQEGGGEVGEGKSEGHAYVEAGSYVFLEMELNRPLIPKRPPSVLAGRIAEYIPSRPALPRKVGGAERAVAEYHSQTATIANTLLEEYRELFGEELQNGAPSHSSEARDERCRKLLFQLNSSGKYHAFKEQLKQAVVRIVREKFLSQAKTQDQSERQAFLSELYVFLTDEMHSGLKKVLSLEGPSPPPPSAVDCELLKHFAFEAEVCRDFELAERYHKERVSRMDHAPSHWYDYGVFCLLVGDQDRSQQCFKEAISLDQAMVPALLLYGMTCCLDEHYFEAEQFFEMATTSDPTNIIAWTMRGLFYELSGNGVYQDMCYLEASKLNSSHDKKTFVTPPLAAGEVGQRALVSQSKASVTPKQAGLKHPSTSSIARGEVPHVMVESTKSLGSGSSQGMGEAVPKAAEDSSPAHPPPPSALTAGGSTESAVSFSKVTSVISEDNGGATPTQLKGEDISVRAGDVEGRAELTQSSHKLTSVSAASIHSGGTPGDPLPPLPASVFLQTASYLLNVHALKFAEMALAHELTHPQGGPSPLYYTAEARLYMHKEQYSKAEESLKKAIAEDFQDSHAWSLLGHTHYLMGDFVSARDCYERTVDYVNRPAHLHTVHLRLADIYLREHQYEKAKATFLRACRSSPSSVTWRGVGIACYKLGDLAESEDALCEANILNNLDPVVWAYLTMVCIKTKRPVEAEQALKFAVKGSAMEYSPVTTEAGLNDPFLVSEISKLHLTFSPSTDLVHLPQLTAAT